MLHVIVTCRDMSPSLNDLKLTAHCELWKIMHVFKFNFPIQILLYKLNLSIPNRVAKAWKVSGNFGKFPWKVSGILKGVEILGIFGNFQFLNILWIKTIFPWNKCLNCPLMFKLYINAVKELKRAHNRLN